MSYREESRLFLLIYRLLKLGAIAFGAGVGILTAAAMLGQYMDAFWLRAFIAVAMALALTIILGRMAPKQSKQRGDVATDILAIGWLAVAVLLSVPANVNEILISESTRLYSDYPRLSAMAAWLAVAERQPAMALQLDASGGDAAGASATTQESKPTSSDDRENIAAEVAAETTEKGTTEKGKTEEGTAVEEVVVAEPDDRPTNLEPTEIFKQYAPSVVAISVRSKDGGSIGTGFVIDRDGTVVTNHHVIDNAVGVRVKLIDGTVIDRVELLDSDAKEDLAILRLHTQAALKPAVLGTSETIIVGERVISIGNPLGLDHTLTDGIVSSRRVLGDRKVIQMSAPVSPGNSGGPVFNLRGQVIAVTFAQVNPMLAQNLNLAVPIDTLKSMLQPDYPKARFFGKTNW